VTIDLSGKWQKLIDAAEAALRAAEETVAVGTTFGTIGKVIEKTINSYGFSPVKNLSGHGLGYYKIHTEPCVPNYDDGSIAVIRPGMTFAIEPFATDGRGHIEEEGRATIFSFVKRPAGKPSEIVSYILEKIRGYNGLPFALHEFCDGTFPSEQVTAAIYQLQKERVIYGYPPLVEKRECFVAQAENSILVDTHGAVFATTRV
jgi:methionyl aminopeptidase